MHMLWLILGALVATGSGLSVAISLLDGERVRAVAHGLVGVVGTVAFLAGPDAVLGAADWFVESPTLQLAGYVLCGVTALLVASDGVYLGQRLRGRGAAVSAAQRRRVEQGVVLQPDEAIAELETRHRLALPGAEADR